MNLYISLSRCAAGRRGKRTVYRGTVDYSDVRAILCRSASAWLPWIPFSRTIFGFAASATHSRRRLITAATVQWPIQQTVSNHPMQRPNVDQESRGTRKTWLAGRHVYMYVRRSLARTFSITDAETDNCFNLLVLIVYTEMIFTIMQITGLSHRHRTLHHL